MKTLKSFPMLLLVGILLLISAGCEKNDPVVPDVPEPSEFIEITLKAVADDLYYAEVFIPELNYEVDLPDGDNTYTWKSIDYPFLRASYEDQLLEITMEVHIYEEGYPGPVTKKSETKQVLICDDNEGETWNFYE